jgi:uncharacterized protein YfiM (DUF2279 family)
MTLLLFLQIGALFSQKTEQTNPEVTESQPLITKKRAVIGGGAVLYGSSMLMLNELWYKDFPRSGFHSFNDNQEWLQMDKVGHGMTSYYLGLVGDNSLRWAGVDERKSAIWGGMTGLFYLTGIEVLDGFSTEWGLSWGDMGANAAGAAIYIGQQLQWGEQRFKLKVSYHHTDFAAVRPEVLGSAWNERMLKDYNGQTYWVSGNISSFLNEDSAFPKWLNVAGGYGVDGLISGFPDPLLDHDGTYNRTRQCYLSLDVDLSQLDIKNPWLRGLTKTIGFIKFPAPTLEFGVNGVKGYWVYF